MSRASWQTDLYRFVDEVENGDLSTAFQAVDEVISGGFEQNFYNQVDNTGKIWEPRLDNLSHPLLIKSGRMFSAATNPADPGHLHRATGNVLVIGIMGSAVPYAIFHHEGTRYMPSRRVIYVTPETEQRAFEAFEQAIFAMMKV